MTQEPFQLMPVENWPELQSTLREHWPRCLPGYNVLETQSRWQKEGLCYGFKVYSLFGDLKNGFVAVNNKVNNYELIIQYPNDDTDTLERALKTTKRINWDVRITLAFTAYHVISAVQKVIRIKNKDLVLDLIPSYTFIVEKGSPLFENASLPPGFTFELLSSQHVDLIDAKWPHRYPLSTWYFQLLIDCKSGYGLFKNGEIACWIFISECGHLTHLYTIEEYRKQGLAELILKLISNELMKTNKQVSAFCVKVAVIGSCVEAQTGNEPPQDHGHGWDIRLAVPGEPGSDYPTLSFIPRTSFSCAGKEPGYYADAEAGCQVFRICTVGSTYGFQSFLCPNGTLFNQEVFVCDWWMNVKCQSSQRFFSARNEMFGNLRLGPQLMKDIKKMLTHPMRNPYDKTIMKDNFIVMQDYKPPAGQLFPNSALIAGPERPPINVYVPAKQIQQNYQTYNPNDIAFAASTPVTKYIPADFANTPLNNDAEVFQRQKQSARYVQNSNVQTTQHSGIGNSVANGHTPQFSQIGRNGKINNIPQPRQNHNFNQANLQYTQSQRTNSIPLRTGNIQNNQRVQLNRQRAQSTDIKKLTQSNGQQNEIVSYTNQQFNQGKQPYTYNPTNLPLPREQKQNLALVFSFLADSLNAAKKYNNLVKQDMISSTSTPTSQFQNLNNEDLSQITSKVSQLTSSHFSGNNFNRANIAQAITRPSSTTQLNQENSKTQANQQNQAQYNVAPSLQAQRQYVSRFQPDENILNTNLLNSNQNQIYSGQLYQFPVPEVTNHIYNRPQSGNIVQTNLEQNTQTASSPQTTNQNNNLAARNNLAKQSSAEVEIVRSQTLPLNPAKLQLEPSNEPESFYSQENLNSLLNSDNGISAQLQDKIVGTISHHLEDNKVLTYEKDQSYYLYTKFNKGKVMMFDAIILAGKNISMLLILTRSFGGNANLENLAKVYAVSGKYEYYHYLCDGVDDKGWGCGYRTLQTICSWMTNNCCANSTIPSIKQIQSILVEMEDKPRSFLGSRQWIGSVEVCLVIDKLYDVPCKILHVTKGDELTTIVGELVNHFDMFGSPIMMGGDMDCSSKGIMGIDVGGNHPSLLIVDPHYVGKEKSKEFLQFKGWVKWQPLNDFLSSSFYNLCLPQVKGKSK